MVRKLPAFIKLDTRVRTGIYFIEYFTHKGDVLASVKMHLSNDFIFDWPPTERKM